MSRHVNGIALLACLGGLGHISPAVAQTDMSVAIAELRAENARLAARLDALQRELENQRAGNPATASPSSSGRAETAASRAPAAELQAPATFPASPIRTVETVVPPGPPDRPVQGGGIGLQLNASSGGGQVAITFGQTVRKTGVTPGQVHGAGTTWSITASAPIAKSGDTALGTLDSFTDSSTLRVRIGRLFVTMPNLLAPGSAYQSLARDATDACIAKAKDESGKNECRESDIDQGFIQKWLPGSVNDYIRLTTMQRLAWGFGIEGSVGYRKYKFIDSTSLADASVERVPWGVKLFGAVLPSPTSALTASIAYQQGYDERRATILCPVAGAGATLVCLSGPNGRPVRTEKVLLALEGRKLFDLTRTPLQNGVVDRIGFAPQITYDANNDDLGIDVPIYLAADDKGNLIGGFRFGYKSGDEGFNAGVFVGAAFDLFK